MIKLGIKRKHILSNKGHVQKNIELKVNKTVKNTSTYISEWTLNSCQDRVLDLPF